MKPLIRQSCIEPRRTGGTTMRKSLVWSGVIGVCVMLGTAGCAAGSEAPGYTGVHKMTGLDGRLDTPDGLISPVMQDVYDRSIPEEVYSIQ